MPNKGLSTPAGRLFRMGDHALPPGVIWTDARRGAGRSHVMPEFLLASHAYCRGGHDEGADRVVRHFENLALTHVGPLPAGQPSHIPLRGAL